MTAPRLIGLVRTVCAVALVLVGAGGSPASAQDGDWVQDPAAPGAVAAALAQANATGVTYVEQGVLKQRNAAGTVIIQFDQGKPDGMLVREPDGTVLLYGPPQKQDEFTSIVARAYGLNTTLSLSTGNVPEMAAMLTDPFSSWINIPTSTISTDDQGRLKAVILDGKPELEILSYTAPRAVTPAKADVQDMAMLSQITGISLLGQTLDQQLRFTLKDAQADWRYKRDPVGTFRRYMTKQGWQYARTPGGARVSQIGGSGAKWTMTMNVLKHPDRNVRRTLTQLPPFASAEVANDRSTIGQTLNQYAEGIALTQGFGGKGPTPGNVQTWVKESTDSGVTMTWSSGGSPWTIRIAVQSGSQCGDVVLDPRHPYLQDVSASAGTAGPDGACIAG